MKEKFVECFLGCSAKITRNSNITSFLEFFGLRSLSRYSAFLDMQIIQHVISHCIMTFGKASFKSSRTIAHKQGLVINDSLRTYKGSCFFFLLLYTIGNLIARCVICIFKKLNISTKNTVTKILKKRLYCEFKLIFPMQSRKCWTIVRFIGTLSVYVIV